MDIQGYIKSGVIESYVLGLADERDVAELQRLKLLHPEIESAIEACEQWLEDYAMAHSVAAPRDISADALYILSKDRVKMVPSGGRQQGSSINFYKYLVAASLLLVIASAGSGYYFYRKYEKAAANYAILADPEIIRVSLHGVAGKEHNQATLYWNPKTRNAYLEPDHLPSAPAGKQFQVWALVDGKPIDAGLLETGNGLCHLKPVEKAQAFAITLEKTGGSPTPTLSQLYVMGKVKT